MPDIGPRRLDIDDYAESFVGAAARRQTRQRIVSGVFGALLVAVAGLVYWQMRPAGDGATTRAARVRCSACGRTYDCRVAVDEIFPVKCRECRALAARELWKCRECSSEFIPPIGRHPVRCPRCNGEQVGAAGAGGAPGS